MTENPRLQTLLELFHHARKQEAIIGKLQCKLYELNQDMRDIKKALLSLSPWQVGDILYRDATDVTPSHLAIVKYLRMDAIGSLAMRPEFEYRDAAQAIGRVIRARNNKLTDE